MTVFSSPKLAELSSLYDAMSKAIAPISKELKIACHKGETGEHVDILRKSFLNAVAEQKKVAKAISKEKSKVSQY